MSSLLCIPKKSKKLKRRNSRKHRRVYPSTEDVSASPGVSRSLSSLLTCSSAATPRTGQELERLREEHRRAEAERQEKENDIWTRYEVHRAEIEKQKRLLSALIQESEQYQVHTESEIQQARESLDYERQLNSHTLLSELEVISNLEKQRQVQRSDSGSSTDQSIQTDEKLFEELAVQTESHTVGADAATSLTESQYKDCILRHMTESVLGRRKQLVQTELLQQLAVREAEIALTIQQQDLEDKIFSDRDRIRAERHKLRDMENRHKADSSSRLQKVAKDIDFLHQIEAKEMQLESYIQEKMQWIDSDTERQSPLGESTSEESIAATNKKDRSKGAIPKGTSRLPPSHSGSPHLKSGQLFTKKPQPQNKSSEHSSEQTLDKTRSKKSPSIAEKVTARLFPKTDRQKHTFLRRRGSGVLHSRTKSAPILFPGPGQNAKQELERRKRCRSTSPEIISNEKQTGSSYAQRMLLRSVNPRLRLSSSSLASVPEPISEIAEEAFDQDYSEYSDMNTSVGSLEWPHSTTRGSRQDAERAKFRQADGQSDEPVDEGDQVVRTMDVEFVIPKTIESSVASPDRQVLTSPGQAFETDHPSNFESDNMARLELTGSSASLSVSSVSESMDTSVETVVPDTSYITAHVQTTVSPSETSHEQSPDATLTDIHPPDLNNSSNNVNLHTDTRSEPSGAISSDTEPEHSIDSNTEHMKSNDNMSSFDKTRQTNSLDGNFDPVTFRTQLQNTLHFQMSVDKTDGDLQLPPESPSTAEHASYSEETETVEEDTLNSNNKTSKSKKFSIKQPSDSSSVTSSSNKSSNQKPTLKRSVRRDSPRGETMLSRPKRRMTADDIPFEIYIPGGSSGGGWGASLEIGGDAESDPFKPNTDLTHDIFARSLRQPSPEWTQKSCTHPEFGANVKIIMRRKSDSAFYTKDRRKRKQVEQCFVPRKLPDGRAGSIDGAFQIKETPTCDPSTSENISNSDTVVSPENEQFDVKDKHDDKYSDDSLNDESCETSESNTGSPNHLLKSYFDVVRQRLEQEQEAGYSDDSLDHQQEDKKSNRTGIHQPDSRQFSQSWPGVATVAAGYTWPLQAAPGFQISDPVGVAVPPTTLFIPQIMPPQMQVHPISVDSQFLTLGQQGQAQTLEPQQKAISALPERYSPTEVEVAVKSLPPAKKSSRQRSRRKLVDQDSSEAECHSDDSAVSGNMSQPSSRPGSGRRRKKPVKYVDSPKKARVSSEEYDVSSESESVYSQDSLVQSDERQKDMDVEMEASPCVVSELANLKASVDALTTALHDSRVLPAAQAPSSGGIEREMSTSSAQAPSSDSSARGEQVSLVEASEFVITPQRTSAELDKHDRALGQIFGQMDSPAFAHHESLTRPSDQRETRSSLSLDIHTKQSPKSARITTALDSSSNPPDQFTDDVSSKQDSPSKSKIWDDTPVPFNIILDKSTNISKDNLDKSASVILTGSKCLQYTDSEYQTSSAGDKSEPVASKTLPDSKYTHVSGDMKDSTTSVPVIPYLPLDVTTVHGTVLPGKSVMSSVIAENDPICVESMTTKSLSGDGHTDSPSVTAKPPVVCNTPISDEYDLSASEKPDISAAASDIRVLECSEEPDKSPMSMSRKVTTVFPQTVIPTISAETQKLIQRAPDPATSLGSDDDHSSSLRMESIDSGLADGSLMQTGSTIDDFSVTDIESPDGDSVFELSSKSPLIRYPSRNSNSASSGPSHVKSSDRDSAVSVASDYEERNGVYKINSVTDYDIAKEFADSQGLITNIEKSNVRGDSVSSGKPDVSSDSSSSRDAVTAGDDLLCVPDSNQKENPAIVPGHPPSIQHEAAKLITGNTPSSIHGAEHSRNTDIGFQQSAVHSENPSITSGEQSTERIGVENEHLDSKPVHTCQQVAPGVSVEAVAMEMDTVTDSTTGLSFTQISLIPASDVSSSVSVNAAEISQPQIADSGELCKGSTVNEVTSTEQNTSDMPPEYPLRDGRSAEHKAVIDKPYEETDQMRVQSKVILQAEDRLDGSGICKTASSESFFSIVATVGSGDTVACLAEVQMRPADQNPDTPNQAEEFPPTEEIWPGSLQHEVDTVQENQSFSDRPIQFMTGRHDEVRTSKTLHPDVTTNQNPADVVMSPVSNVVMSPVSDVVMSPVSNVLMSPVSDVVMSPVSGGPLTPHIQKSQQINIESESEIKQAAVSVRTTEHEADRKQELSMTPDPDNSIAQISAADGEMAEYDISTVPSLRRQAVGISFSTEELSPRHTPSSLNTRSLSRQIHSKMLSASTGELSKPDPQRSSGSDRFPRKMLSSLSYSTEELSGYANLGSHEAYIRGLPSPLPVTRWASTGSDLSYSGLYVTDFHGDFFSSPRLVQSDLLSQHYSEHSSYDGATSEEENRSVDTGEYTLVHFKAPEGKRRKRRKLQKGKVVTQTEDLSMSQMLMLKVRQPDEVSCYLSSDPQNEFAVATEVTSIDVRKAEEMIPAIQPDNRSMAVMSKRDDGEVTSVQMDGKFLNPTKASDTAGRVEGEIRNNVSEPSPREKANMIPASEPSVMDEDTVIRDSDSMVLATQPTSMNKDTVNPANKLSSRYRDTMIPASELSAMDKDSKIPSNESSSMDSDGVIPANESSAMDKDTMNHASEVSDMDKDTMNHASEVSDMDKDTMNHASEVSDMDKDTMNHASEVSDMNKDTMKRASEVSDMNKDTMIPASELSAMDKYTMSRASELSDMDEDTVIPSNESSSMDSDGVIPANESSTMDKDTMNHASELSAMDKDTMIPASELSAMDKDSKIPSDESSAIDSDGVVLAAEPSDMNKDTMINASEVSDMNKDTMIPASELSAMDKDTVIPSNETSVRDSDSMILATEPSAMDKDTMVLATELPCMDKDTVIQANEPSSMDSDGVILSTELSAMDRNIVIPASELYDSNAAISVPADPSVTESVKSAEVLQGPESSFTGDEEMIDIRDPVTVSSAFTDQNNSQRETTEQADRDLTMDVEPDTKDDVWNVHKTESSTGEGTDSEMHEEYNKAQTISTYLPDFEDETASVDTVIEQQKTGVTDETVSMVTEPAAALVESQRTNKLQFLQEVLSDSSLSEYRSTEDEEYDGIEIEDSAIWYERVSSDEDDIGRSTYAEVILANKFAASAVVPDNMILTGDYPLSVIDEETESVESTTPRYIPSPRHLGEDVISVPEISVIDEEGKPSYPVIQDSASQFAKESQQMISEIIESSGAAMESVSSEDSRLESSEEYLENINVSIEKSGVQETALMYTGENITEIYLPESSMQNMLTSIDGSEAKQDETIHLPQQEDEFQDVLMDATRHGPDAEDVHSQRCEDSHDVMMEATHGPAKDIQPQKHENSHDDMMEATRETPAKDVQTQSDQDSHDDMMEATKQTPAKDVQPQSGENSQDLMEATRQTPAKDVQSQIHEDSHDDMMEATRQTPAKDVQSQSGEDSYDDMMEATRQTPAKDVQSQSCEDSYDDMMEASRQTPAKDVQSQSGEDSYDDMMEAMRQTPAKDVQSLIHEDSHDDMMEAMRQTPAKDVQPQRGEDSHDDMMEATRQTPAKDVQSQSHEDSHDDVMEATRQTPAKDVQSQSHEDSHDDVMEATRQTPAKDVQPQSHEDSHDVVVEARRLGANVKDVQPHEDSHDVVVEATRHGVVVKNVQPHEDSHDVLMETMKHGSDAEEVQPQQHEDSQLITSEDQIIYTDTDRSAVGKDFQLADVLSEEQSREDFSHIKGDEIRAPRSKDAVNDLPEIDRLKALSEKETGNEKTENTCVETVEESKMVGQIHVPGEPASTGKIETVEEPETIAEIKSSEVFETVSQMETTEELSTVSEMETNREQAVDNSVKVTEDQKTSADKGIVNEIKIDGASKTTGEAEISSEFYPIVGMVTDVTEETKAFGDMEDEDYIKEAKELDSSKIQNTVRGSEVIIAMEANIPTATTDAESLTATENLHAIEMASPMETPIKARDLYKSQLQRIQAEIEREDVLSVVMTSDTSLSPGDIIMTEVSDRDQPKAMHDNLPLNSSDIEMLEMPEKDNKLPEQNNVTSSEKIQSEKTSEEADKSRENGASLQSREIARDGTEAEETTAVKGDVITSGRLSPREGLMSLLVQQAKEKILRKLQEAMPEALEISLEETINDILAVEMDEAKLGTEEVPSDESVLVSMIEAVQHERDVLHHGCHSEVDGFTGRDRLVSAQDELSEPVPSKWSSDSMIAVKRRIVEVVPVRPTEQRLAFHQESLRDEDSVFVCEIMTTELMESPREEIHQDTRVTMNLCEVPVSEFPPAQPASLPTDQNAEMTSQPGSVTAQPVVTLEQVLRQYVEQHIIKLEKSQSDPAIRSDHNTDTESTTVSPKTRLYDSNKVLYDQTSPPGSSSPNQAALLQAYKGLVKITLSQKQAESADTDDRADRLPIITTPYSDSDHVDSSVVPDGISVKSTQLKVAQSDHLEDTTTQQEAATEPMVQPWHKVTDPDSALNKSGHEPVESDNLHEEITMEVDTVVEMISDDLPDLSPLPSPSKILSDISTPSSILSPLPSPSKILSDVSTPSSVLSPYHNVAGISTPPLLESVTYDVYDTDIRTSTPLESVVYGQNVIDTDIHTPSLLEAVGYEQRFLPPDEDSTTCQFTVNPADTANEVIQAGEGSDLERNDSLLTEKDALLKHYGLDREDSLPKYPSTSELLSELQTCELEPIERPRSLSSNDIWEPQSGYTRAFSTDSITYVFMSRAHSIDQFASDLPQLQRSRHQSEPVCSAEETSLSNEYENETVVPVPERSVSAECLVMGQSKASRTRSGSMDATRLKEKALQRQQEAEQRNPGAIFGGMNYTEEDLTNDMSDNIHQANLEAVKTFEDSFKLGEMSADDVTQAEKSSNDREVIQSEAESMDVSQSVVSGKPLKKGVSWSEVSHLVSSPNDRENIELKESSALTHHERIKASPNAAVTTHEESVCKSPQPQQAKFEIAMDIDTAKSEENIAYLLSSENANTQCLQASLESLLMPKPGGKPPSVFRSRSLSPLVLSRLRSISAPTGLGALLDDNTSPMGNRVIAGGSNRRRARSEASQTEATADSDKSADLIKPQKQKKRQHSKDVLDLDRAPMDMSPVSQVDTSGMNPDWQRMTILSDHMTGTLEDGRDQVTQSSLEMSRPSQIPGPRRTSAETSDDINSWRGLSALMLEIPTRRGGAQHSLYSGIHDVHSLQQTVRNRADFVKTKELVVTNVISTQTGDSLETDLDTTLCAEVESILSADVKPETTSMCTQTDDAVQHVYEDGDELMRMDFMEHFRIPVDDQSMQYISPAGSLEELLPVTKRYANAMTSTPTYPRELAESQSTEESGICVDSVSRSLSYMPVDFGTQTLPVSFVREHERTESAVQINACDLNLSREFSVQTSPVSHESSLLHAGMEPNQQERMGREFSVQTSPVSHESSLLHVGMEPDQQERRERERMGREFSVQTSPVSHESSPLHAGMEPDQQERRERERMGREFSVQTSPVSHEFSPLHAGKEPYQQERMERERMGRDFSVQTSPVSHESSPLHAGKEPDQQERRERERMGREFSVQTSPVSHESSPLHAGMEPDQQERRERERMGREFSVQTSPVSQLHASSEPSQREGMEREFSVQTSPAAFLAAENETLTPDNELATSVDVGSSTYSPVAFNSPDALQMAAQSVPVIQPIPVRSARNGIDAGNSVEFFTQTSPVEFEFRSVGPSDFCVQTSPMESSEDESGPVEFGSQTDISVTQSLPLLRPYFSRGVGEVVSSVMYRPAEASTQTGAVSIATQTGARDKGTQTGATNIATQTGAMEFATQTWEMEIGIQTDGHDNSVIRGGMPAEKKSLEYASQTSLDDMKEDEIHQVEYATQTSPIPDSDDNSKTFEIATQADVPEDVSREITARHEHHRPAGSAPIDSVTEKENMITDPILIDSVTEEGNMITDPILIDSVTEEGNMMTDPIQSSHFLIPPAAQITTPQSANQFSAQLTPPQSADQLPAQLTTPESANQHSVQITTELANQLARQIITPESANEQAAQITDRDSVTNRSEISQAMHEAPEKVLCSDEESEELIIIQTKRTVESRNITVHPDILNMRRPVPERRNIIVDPDVIKLFHQSDNSGEFEMSDEEMVTTSKTIQQEEYIISRETAGTCLLTESGDISQYEAVLTESGDISQYEAGRPQEKIPISPEAVSTIEFTINDTVNIEEAAHGEDSVDLTRGGIEPPEGTSEFENQALDSRSDSDVLQQVLASEFVQNVFHVAEKKMQELNEENPEIDRQNEDFVQDERRERVDEIMPEVGQIEEVVEDIIEVSMIERLNNMNVQDEIERMNEASTESGLTKIDHDVSSYERIDRLNENDGDKSTEIDEQKIGEVKPQTTDLTGRKAEHEHEADSRQNEESNQDTLMVSEQNLPEQEDSVTDLKGLVNNNKYKHLMIPEDRSSFRKSSCPEPLSELAIQTLLELAQQKPPDSVTMNAADDEGERSSVKSDSSGRLTRSAERTDVTMVAPQYDLTTPSLESLRSEYENLLSMLRSREDEQKMRRMLRQKRKTEFTSLQDELKELEADYERGSNKPSIDEDIQSVSEDAETVRLMGEIKKSSSKESEEKNKQSQGEHDALNTTGTTDDADLSLEDMTLDLSKVDASRSPDLSLTLDELNASLEPASRGQHKTGGRDEDAKERRETSEQSVLAEKLKSLDSRYNISLALDELSAEMEEDSEELRAENNKTPVNDDSTEKGKDKDREDGRLAEELKSLDARYDSEQGGSVAVHKYLEQLRIGESERPPSRTSSVATQWEEEETVTLTSGAAVVSQEKVETDHLTSGQSRDVPDFTVATTRSVAYNTTGTQIDDQLRPSHYQDYLLRTRHQDMMSPRSVGSSMSNIHVDFESDQIKLTGAAVTSAQYTDTTADRNPEIRITVRLDAHGVESKTTTDGGAVSRETADKVDDVLSPRSMCSVSSAAGPNRSLNYSDIADDSTQTDVEAQVAAMTTKEMGIETDFRSQQISDELERLRRERKRILDMLAKDVFPSKFQVEIAEAQLNYIIGQTDTLLSALDHPYDTSELVHLGQQLSHPEHQLSEITQHHLVKYRQQLEDSKRSIESRIERLEQEQTRVHKSRSRERQIAQMRRNAQIEAFNMERKRELVSYNRVKSLSPGGGEKNKSDQKPEDGQMKFKPKLIKDKLVGIRKGLVRASKQDRLYRSLSPVRLPPHHLHTRPGYEMYDTHTSASPPYSSSGFDLQYTDGRRSASHSPYRTSVYDTSVGSGLQRGSRYNSSASHSSLYDTYDVDSVTSSLPDETQDLLFEYQQTRGRTKEVIERARADLQASPKMSSRNGQHKKTSHSSSSYRPHTEISEMPYRSTLDKTAQREFATSRDDLESIDDEIDRMRRKYGLAESSSTSYPHSTNSITSRSTPSRFATDFTGVPSSYRSYPDYGVLQNESPYSTTRGSHFSASYSSSSSSSRYGRESEFASSYSSTYTSRYVEPDISRFEHTKPISAATVKAKLERERMAFNRKY